MTRLLRLTFRWIIFGMFVMPLAIMSAFGLMLASAFVEIAEWIGVNNESTR